MLEGESHDFEIILFNSLMQSVKRLTITVALIFQNPSRFSITNTKSTSHVEPSLSITIRNIELFIFLDWRVSNQQHDWIGRANVPNWKGTYSHTQYYDRPIQNVSFVDSELGRI